MTFDVRVASKEIREFAKTLVEEGSFTYGYDYHAAIQGALQLAWCDYVREVWEGYVNATPDLKKRVAIAKVLMEEAGHDQDYVVGMPGAPATICKVDDKEAVCFDVMNSLRPLPLSAIYANKASEVLDAAEKVTAAARATAHKGDVWPLQTAGGDVFNSAEEMASSTNPHVRRFVESFQGRVSLE